MGYMSIDLLYRVPSIMLFKEVWATEKIHGTSAWVTYKDGQLFYHAGTDRPDLKDIFRGLFSKDLFERVVSVFGTKKVKLHGEFYGGKIQKMSHVYGDYGFVMFDVNVDGMWLSFDKVVDVGSKLGIDVVFGKVIPVTVDFIERATNEPSVLAEKRGMGVHVREGIVIRPIEEFRRNNGERVIAKHKTEKYKERRDEPKLDDPARRERERNAEKIAFDWVTERRLEHVIQKIENATKRDTKRVIDGMLADIEKESDGEIVWTDEARRLVGTNTAKLFHDYLERGV